ncbi:DoxX family protein [Chondrinema litorale]|uniref:DoxX family protein n=1 Tax=Chondrinema litorale TaxID=2994555 RepID=UPI0025431B44|nr:DoxX family protein [Chondrinema litorale]UZR95868.1 DoxX family protein [Chondrinema litorale]
MIKKFLIGSVEQSSSTTNLALLILRVFTGLSMALAHGFGKLPPSAGFIEATGNIGFPLPVFFAWAAALSEFVGGILITLGLLTRPASLLMSLTMITAAFITHSADPFATKEKALLYLCISIVLLLTGSGKYGIDAAFQKNNSKPIYYS